MSLAIITDSTSDLRPDELEALDVRRVPLYVSFKGETHRDWIDIQPETIIAGVEAGADLPTTSQPSPQDFETAYREAIEAGADEILVLSISSELSGTYQSAMLAKNEIDVPVTVFDSRSASMGLGAMVKTACRMRDEGASVDAILEAVAYLRDTNYLLFTVGSLDFLQKGGRIGAASAFVGGLLNIKPILSLEDGLLAPVTRARGAKKALREIVTRLQEYRDAHEGTMVVDFLHIQDVDDIDALRTALDETGMDYVDGGVHEFGAVIASHVGPGCYGLYAHLEPAS